MSKSILEFIKTDKLESLEIYLQLKCDLDEAKLLQYMTKQYIVGNDNLMVVDILAEFYDTKNYEHIDKIFLIKNLLELGWIVGNNFHHIKLNEISNLELINTSVSLSISFLKLLEEGNLEFVLPDITQYNDHLEYLQDQFFKIDLAQKLNVIKHNFDDSSPNANRLKSKLMLLDNRIKERVAVTDTGIMIESFFKEHDLSDKEQMIFLTLLKEEYAGGDEQFRDMNSLINLISNDDYEKIKHRSLLEENSKLLSNNLLDYDEMLTPFGGITRNFYIPDEILYKISHPVKKQTRKRKVKLDKLIEEQNTFELVSTKRSLDEIVLNPKTREVLNTLISQMDRNVISRLKKWGIKDKRKGIDSKIIFYGAAGTGKTITSLALANSLKKDIISFDCSKILSMYVGESEKNVRGIFDKYKELVEKSKSEPILLLNEADQFLSSRSTDAMSGSDKMHNQMQNIFLEQIERFDGILIATTNLLENIDKAFSRRFNYKIEFEKPNKEQRVTLWKTLLPEKLPISDDLNFDKLSEHNLTGGQIEMIIKNTAYEMAVKDEPIFNTKTFIDQIEKEKKSMFDSDKSVGFLS